MQCHVEDNFVLSPPIYIFYHCTTRQPLKSWATFRYGQSHLILLGLDIIRREASRCQRSGYPVTRGAAGLNYFCLTAASVVSQLSIA